MMTRRSLLQGGMCAFAATFLFGCAPTIIDTPASDLNVLFIMIDDLNDRVGYMSQDLKALTPNLDALADEATVFINAHSQATACNPSRASMITGLLPKTTGIYKNGTNWLNQVFNAKTIVENFKENGYACKCAGKIDHPKYQDSGPWDQYETRENNAGLLDPLPANPDRFAHVGINNFDWGPLDVGIDQMGDSMAADLVVQWFHEPTDRPLFIGYGINKPHLPFYYPRQIEDLYPIDTYLPANSEDDLDDVPQRGKNLIWSEFHQAVIELNQWENVVQSYLASATYADYCLGKVIEGLKQSGKYESTLIFLGSDHGFHLGEKGHWAKFVLWRQATRIPMLISAPGFRNGERKNGPVGLIDIYPTLVDYCNLTDVNSIEGNSLRGIIENRQPELEYAVTYFRRTEMAVQTERWRYIRYFDNSEELYDHEADPNEWRNLAGFDDSAPLMDDFRRIIQSNHL